jgi:hypothetical protein
LPFLLEYPPVLTPRTIELLNGRLAAQVRHYLLALTEQAIEGSFKPLAAYKGKQLSRKFNECCRMYEPYRLEIIRVLLQEVEIGNLLEILQTGIELLRQEIEPAKLERIGLNADWLRKVISDYWNAVAPLLAYARTPSALDVNLEEHEGMLRGFWWSATQFDFSLTSIFLALEDEIMLQRPVAGYLVSALDKALSQFVDDVTLIVEKPDNPEERFWCLMRRKGMWLGEKPPDKRKRRVKTSFKPIRVKGEPVSETIIRERR